MCWERSRFEKNDGNFPKRSDDNRDGRPRSDNKSGAGFPATNEEEEDRLTPSAMVTRQPGEKPVPPDLLFQERSGIHEEVSVKTKRARRSRDYPDIHSA